MHNITQGHTSARTMAAAEMGPHWGVMTDVWRALEAQLTRRRGLPAHDDTDMRFCSE
jgi:hypothetical protein